MREANPPPPLEVAGAAAPPKRGEALVEVDPKMELEAGAPAKHKDGMICGAFTERAYSF